MSQALTYNLTLNSCKGSGPWGCQGSYPPRAPTLGAGGAAGASYWLLESPAPPAPRPWFLSRRTLCLLVVKMASASAESPLPPLPLSSQFAAATVATTATSAAARESELRRSTLPRP